MYRAFFAIPKSVTGPAGNAVNAVHGYLDMSSRLVGAQRPDEVIHVHDDDWRPAPRVAVYAGYKSNRPPDPEGLPAQFDLLREILEALGAAQADAPGWEAEDAIGVLCASGRAEAAPHRARGGTKRITGGTERVAGGTLRTDIISRGTLRTDIVTGDRDLIQLVRDPEVRVLFTVKGVSELRVLDEAGVRARFGVPPERYADFAILRGDPSDGLPGVRGVGEKTARLLVDAYPDLESLVADATAPVRTGRLLQRSPGLRTAVRDAAGYIAAMREVVPIRTDVDVRTWSVPRSDERLDELAERHGLQAPIGRLRRALSNEGAASAGRPADGPTRWQRS